MTKEELETVQIYIKDMIMNRDISEFISFKDEKYIVDFRIYLELCKWDLKNSIYLK